MFDWLDPAKWVAGIVNGLADLVVNFYLNLVTQIINLLFTAAIPTTEALKSNFFTQGLGATFGLANQLMVLVTLGIAFVVILMPLKNHGAKLSRGISSMLLISVFAVLFYPVYGLLYSVSQGLTQAVINLATSSSSGTTKAVIEAMKVTMPGDALWKLLTAALTVLFGLLTWVEAYGLRAMLIFLLWCYPLAIVLRPLNSFTRVLFNACNAGIVTVLFSPPIMALGFVLPLIVRNLVPGGNDGFASAALAVVGGVFALVTPLLIAFLVFQTSKEVFGKVDASMSGKLDINSMPPVSMDDVKQDIVETQSHPLKDAARDILVGKMLNDDLFGDMKKSDIAALAATATGHPEIGGAIKMGAQFLHKNDAPAGSPPPSQPASSMPPQPPPPPQQPPSGGTV